MQSGLIYLLFQAKSSLILSLSSLALVPPFILGGQNFLFLLFTSGLLVFLCVNILISHDLIVLTWTVGAGIYSSSVISVEGVNVVYISTLIDSEWPLLLSCLV